MNKRLDNNILKFVTWEQVSEITTLSEDHIMTLIETEDFPLPVELVNLEQAFVLNEIKEWQISKMLEREDSNV